MVLFERIKPPGLDEVDLLMELSLGGCFELLEIALRAVYPYQVQLLRQRNHGRVGFDLIDADDPHWKGFLPHEIYYPNSTRKV